MSMSYRQKIKKFGRRQRISKARKIWGFILFLTSTIFLPIVFSITYFQNRKENYTFKQFWKAYKDALKDMLKGTWRD